MRMQVRRTPVLPLMAGGLLLAGCTGGLPSGSADSTSSPGTPPSSETSPTASDEPEESSPAGPSAGGECLEGEWAADVDATREVKLSAPGISQLDPRVEVSGDSFVTFDGSTMTTEYEDQVTELTLTMEGADIVVMTTLDGTVSASYTATDTELTVSDVDIESLTVESTATMGGEEAELPDLQDVEMFGIDLSGVSDYACDDETLEITPQIEGVGSFSLLLTRD